MLTMDQCYALKRGHEFGLTHKRLNKSNHVLNIYILLTLVSTVLLPRWAVKNLLNHFFEQVRLRKIKLLYVVR